MAQNITLLGASYSAVPTVTLPKTGGGTARFDDCTVVTAAASDVAQGKVFIASDGTITTGTASGGGGSSLAMPTFTLTWDDNFNNIISITCDKTLAECFALIQNNITGAVVNVTNQSQTFSFEQIAYSTDEEGSYCTYTVLEKNMTFCDLKLYANGTVDYIEPSSRQRFLNITQNGYYDGDVGIIEGVDVSVPTGGATLQAKTNIAPTTSSQTITPDSGYDGLSSVQINAMPSGTAGTPTATKGTVSNHSVSVTPSVTNTTGYITGSTKTGTAVTVSASELVSGTLSVTSSGTKDVTNYASASIPAGTEGTPTATKGTVSNHSVSVTPSVTNGSGFISGGTHTGTAVTVSASELVSGSQNITTNGTVDVTNLASVVVNVSGGGGSGLTLLKETALGSLSTSSTSAVDTGKTMTVTGYNDYDVLVVDVSVDTMTNGRHTSTVSFVILTGTANVNTKNTYSVASNKWNSKLGSTGTATTRQATSGYGIYVNSASVSGSTMTLTFYYRYNTNSTGTLNGTYTARVYGLKLYELIGG